MSAKALLSLQACRTRAILTVDQAVEIFKTKFESGLQYRARSIAEMYGISEKAVRDIWNGRTWHRETLHLDPARAGVQQQLRLPGRPRGIPQGTKKGRTNTIQFTQSKLSGKPTSLPDNNCTHSAENFAKNGLWTQHAVEWDVLPLPESSSLEDPFHDDWLV